MNEENKDWTQDNICYSYSAQDIFAADIIERIIHDFEQVNKEVSVGSVIDYIRNDLLESLLDSVEDIIDNYN